MPPSIRRRGAAKVPPASRNAWPQRLHPRGGRVAAGGHQETPPGGLLRPPRRAAHRPCAPPRAATHATVIPREEVISL